MITNKQRLYTSLFCNIVLVILGAFSILMLMFNSGKGFSFYFLIKFTHYSSLFLLVSSVLKSIELFNAIRGKEVMSSYPLRVFRFMAVTSSALVSFVVIFLLIPLAHFQHIVETLFGGMNLIEYVLCPLIASFSFIYLGDNRAFGTKEAILATLPTFLYAVVSTTLNVLRVIEGPYVFLYVYRQPVWISVLYFIVIVALSYMLANVILIISHKDNLVEKIEKD